MFIPHCQSAGLQHPKEAIIPWKPLLLGGLLPKPQKLGPGLVRSRYNFWLCGRPFACLLALCLCPPKDTVSSRAAAARPYYTEKPQKTTCSELCSAETWNCGNQCRCKIFRVSVHVTAAFCVEQSLPQSAHQVVVLEYKMLMSEGVFATNSQLC